MTPDEAKKAERKSGTTIGTKPIIMIKNKVYGTDSVHLSGSFAGFLE